MATVDGMRFEALAIAAGERNRRPVVPTYNLYGNGFDEYEVCDASGNTMGYVKREFGAWTAYPRDGRNGVAGYGTTDGAAAQVAEWAA